LKNCRRLIKQATKKTATYLRKIEPKQRLGGLFSYASFSNFLNYSTHNTPLIADPESKRLKQWLKADKNSDGVLKNGETSRLMRRFFDRNDRDGNGKLTKEELDKRL
jgi:hypothetical protein